jgi:hypothetical protein
MGEVTFKVPDEFVATKGAAMLAGWEEDPDTGEPIQKIYYRSMPGSDISTWEMGALFREGLREMDSQMNIQWFRAREKRG